MYLLSNENRTCPVVKATERPPRGWTAKESNTAGQQETCPQERTAAVFPREKPKGLSTEGQTWFSVLSYGDKSFPQTLPWVEDLRMQATINIISHYKEFHSKQSDSGENAGSDDLIQEKFPLY